MGWRPVVLGFSGAGYLKENGKGITIPSKLTGIPEAHPDVLVPAAGRNDLGMGDEALRAAVSDVIAKVKQTSPETKVAVVGPWPGSGSPSRMFLTGRDALAAAAAEHQVAFIDPIAGQWIAGDRSEGTGNAVEFIAEDEVHATEAGHAHIAAKMVEALRAAGF